MQAGLPNFHTPTYTIRLNRLRLDGTLVKEFPDIDLRSPSGVTYFIHPNTRVWAQRVYVGDGTINGIRVFGGDGRLTHIIRSADTAQRITPADIERSLGVQPPMVQANLRKQWIPDAFPTYSSFRIDAEGRLWVQHFVNVDKRTDVDSWTAFDINGKLIGRLEVPRRIGNRGVSVMGFGLNEVQLMQSDDKGNYRLAFYPIERIAPRQ
jgi:hypothetical protein